MTEGLVGRVVELPSLERGQVIGQLLSGEYLLEYGEGGKIIVFHPKEPKGTDTQKELTIEYINDIIADIEVSEDEDTRENVFKSIERLMQILNITDNDLSENLINRGQY